ncbi:MAG: hypothetical protein QNJ98_14440 [Planctomycetota bacterium]|nr:hypothetical protein [Planctomycetota bacterium]
MDTSLRIVGLMTLGLFLLTACGGGGGGDANLLQPGEVRLSTLANMDGTVPVLGATVDTTAQPSVGYSGPAVTDARWAFFTFDLSGIPAGATVTAAQLELFQTATLGTPTDVLPILVDHMEASGATPTWTELVGSSFELEAPIRDSGGNPATVSHTTVRGNRFLDVTRQVQRDLAEGRSFSRFRLRWEPVAGPITFGLVYFSDAENIHGSDVPPALVVGYQ